MNLRSPHPVNSNLTSSTEPEVLLETRKPASAGLRERILHARNAAASVRARLATDRRYHEAPGVTSAGLPGGALQWFPFQLNFTLFVPDSFTPETTQRC